MNKAVTAVFPDSASASRAINDLKAHGFGGENVSHVVREDAPRSQKLPGPRLLPAMELLKGLVIGAIAGAIMGLIADWYLGMNLTWPGLGFTRMLVSAVLTFAAVGAIAAILEGLAAAAPLSAARRFLQSRRRGDAIVSVHTDEAHAGQAIDILRAAGAWDVRRGASSLPDEFRTIETVQPEPYGATMVVQREMVGTPTGSANEADSGTPAEARMEGEQWAERPGDPHGGALG